MRREQRIALAQFRHHANPCTYSGRYGDRVKIRYTDHKGVDLIGDDNQVVATVNALMFLNSELPKSESGDTVVTENPKETFKLGREIKDDGFMRTIEVIEK